MESARCDLRQPYRIAVERETVKAMEANLLQRKFPSVQSDPAAKKSLHELRREAIGPDSKHDQCREKQPCLEEKKKV